MEFRILGPFEVLVDGRRVALGGDRQRAVLAVLLLHRGEIVSTDRIVDELWGDRAPATATKTVQVYVSRLRKGLGNGALVTRGGGYALEVGDEDVDADRFERLAREGREALEGGDLRRSEERLNAALGLWQGPPLSDFEYEQFAQAEVERLSEMRLAALEDRAEAGLDLGRHAALVPELEALVNEHPLRERPRAQLMLALYRCGRQSDALAVYRDGQRRLDEELGLQPGPELRRMERAVLDQDPAISPPGKRETAAGRGRRGAALVVIGGLLLLGAVIAAIVAATGGGHHGPGPVPPDSLAVIDPGSNRLMETVPTGVRPGDVSADGRHVWVANLGDNSVTEVDPRGRTVVGTVSAGPSVAGLAAGAGGVWVSDSRAWTLTRIDPSFGSVSRLIRLAPRPDVFSVVNVNPVAVGHGAVWVGSSQGGVARVDPSSGRVVTTIETDNAPVAIDAGLGAVWVAGEDGDTVTRIDAAAANAVTDTTPVGQGPASIAAGEGAVWVANTQDDAVARINPVTAAVTDTIDVGRGPAGVATGAGAVWVANSRDGTVSRIDPDTRRVEATVDVGESPQDVEVANGLVWVSVQAREAGTNAPEPGSRDGVARVVAASDPGPTDPALNRDPQVQYATCALLFNYPDRRYPAGTRLEPEAAREWPAVSADGRTYTFRIRPGFRFSPPSGEPVTAAAFERAIERALSPKMGSYAAEIMGDVAGAPAYIRGRAPSISGLSAQGDTLTIELARPAPDLPSRLATAYFCAVPPNTPIVAEGVDSIPTAGPYYVSSHLPDRTLVLSRNPAYRGERPHGLAEIRFDYGVPTRRGVADVEAGRADLVAPNPAFETPLPARLERRLETTFGAGSEAAGAGHQQLFSQPTSDLHFFTFNAHRPTFADRNLRRAVNYAMDRRALAVDTGLGPPGAPTDQYIAPGLPGFEDAGIYPLSGPDLRRARKLAGGSVRRAVLYTCDLPGCARDAHILRTDLRPIGIRLDVRQFPAGEMFTRLQSPGEPWDIGYFNWFIDYPDPSNLLRQFAPGGSIPGVPRLAGLAQAMRSADRLSGQRRLRAYARIDRRLAEDVAPAAPYASGTTSYFLSDRMGCPVLHPIYGLDVAALCIKPHSG